MGRIAERREVLCRASSSRDDYRRVLDKTLVSSYFAVLPPCHLQVDNSLKTDFELRLDTFVLEHILLPQMDEMLAKLQAMVAALEQKRALSGVDIAPVAEAPASNEAMAELVVQVRRLELPLKLSEKFDLALCLPGS
eukprot:m.266328 g.266328  ORF g.266328 m.266328 type:complete len:137 (-) comp19275_c0_seq2:202-612(-)